MLVITLLVLCAGGALTEFRAYDIENAEALFEKFIIDHKKNYQSHQEMHSRFKIFKKNLYRINSYNQNYNKNIMGINLFSDMTKEEFANHHLGCTFPMGVSNCTHGRVDRHALQQEAPASFDWRDHGAVTPVKNQGLCGSCWAFSAIANIESQYALKHSVQLDLSEQQEVDCDRTNHGCAGGLTDKAILNLIDEGGLMLEKDYPYAEKDGDCLFDADRVQAKVTGCLDFTGTDEETIKAILVNYGPLTVSLGGAYMKTYDKGVLPSCDPKINHALLVVGYGTDEQTNEPYWIIKNSWSEHWGENGYLRLLRGNADCEFGKHRLVTSQVA